MVKQFVEFPQTSSDNLGDLLQVDGIPADQQNNSSKSDTAETAQPSAANTNIKPHSLITNSKWLEDRVLAGEVPKGSQASESDASTSTAIFPNDATGVARRNCARYE